MGKKENGYRMELEGFLEDVFEGFSRSEQRKWGQTYVRGLMLVGERKSPGAMALYVPGGQDQSLRHVVTDSTWDAKDVRKKLTEKALEAFPEDRYLIFDETGFPKQGKHSPGVARQYCGTLGKVGNCQVAVSLHLATESISVPIDWELYLPESWTDNPARMKKARIPEGTPFRTKPELALVELDRVKEWGVGTETVLADAAYGTSLDFRKGLTDRGHLYVVGVQGSTAVWVGDVPGGPREKKSRKGRPPVTWDYGDARPTLLEDLARSLPPAAWERVTWEDGNDRKTSLFYWERVHAAPHQWVHGARPEEEEWLLIEWPEGQKKPSHYWLSTLPATTSLVALVAKAKLRWRIELDYRQLKDELGLDHFEGRTLPGWERHVTLVTLAYHFLIHQQLQGKKNG